MVSQCIEPERRMIFSSDIWSVTVQAKTPNLGILRPWRASQPTQQRLCSPASCLDGLQTAQCLHTICKVSSRGFSRSALLSMSCKAVHLRKHIIPSPRDEKERLPHVNTEHTKKMKNHTADSFVTLSNLCRAWLVPPDPTELRRFPFNLEWCDNSCRISGKCSWAFPGMSENKLSRSCDIKQNTSLLSSFLATSTWQSK